MKEKINIAELLKNCPTGMELDCAIYDNCTFDGIEDVGYIEILVKTPSGRIRLTKEGCFTHNDKYAKCVIFPKGKTTWEGFVPPCGFKDGDIVFYNDTIAIFKEWGDETLFRTYVTKYLCCDLLIDTNVPLFGKGIRKETRFATEEEKQKLFDTIKANGFKWNAETKTLEKLVEPKFKVGDKIVRRNSITNSWIVDSVTSKYYGLKLSQGSENIGVLPVSEQDDWELVPNKFNITTLKPFDKVLVRDNNTHKWTADLFSLFDKSLIYPYSCVGHYTNQCIPYEGNKHLLGTTNDCDDYYKTWEN